MKIVSTEDMSQNKKFKLKLFITLLLGLYLVSDKAQATPGPTSGEFGLSQSSPNYLGTNKIYVDYAELMRKFEEQYKRWLKNNPSQINKEKTFKVQFEIPNTRPENLGYTGYTPSPDKKYITLPYEFSGTYNLRIRFIPKNVTPAHKPIDLPVSQASTPEKSNSSSVFLSAQKSKSDVKACHNRYRPLDQIRDGAVLSEAEQRIKDRCLRNSNDRSFDCIHWVTHQAVRAMSTAKGCSGRVTVDKLMCIYGEETKNNYYTNVCNSKSGACGLAQMTEGGARVVQKGLNEYGLAPQMDLFWDLINKPRGKEIKCSLTNRSAMDRNTSIIMAATYMCTMVKEKPLRTDLQLNCLYNGGPKYCEKTNPNGNSSYARRALNCEREQTWRQVKQSMYIYKRARCRAEPETCPDDNVATYKFAGSSINGGFAVK